jgi:hypothetical protein
MTVGAMTMILTTNVQEEITEDQVVDIHKEAMESVAMIILMPMRVQGGIILILLLMCILAAAMVHRGVHRRIPPTTQVSSSNLDTLIITILRSSILVNTT